MYMYAVNVCNMSLYILKKEFLSRTLWINKNAKICGIVLMLNQPKRKNIINCSIKYLILIKTLNQVWAV